MKLHAKLLLVSLVLTAAGCIRNEKIPEDRQYVARFCLARDRWGRVEAMMRKFGTDNGLAFHGGGVEETPSGPMLNLALSKGRHLDGDYDLFLSLTTSPFEPTNAQLSTTTRTSITPENVALAKRLESSLARYRCG